MLRLNRFSYLAPASLEEAAAMVEEHGEEAELMAGGTDLLVNIKHRIATPKYVIGIRRLRELNQLGVDQDGWLRIGAGISLTRIEHDPLVGSRYPALSHAAQLISSPQVRGMGTIGGN